MIVLKDVLGPTPELDRTTYRPLIFRADQADDRARLAELVKRTPGLRVHDTLHGQLRELVRTLHPDRTYTPAELDAAAVAHLQGIDPEHYGVWVFYPWNDRLVHLLGEDEFVRVRTDRNRNKITSEEQALLRTKRVGVVGLSVGQSAALVLAMERCCGELRLADFDDLELSNLNRIRSGVHEMGVPKVVNTAREIAELDPFLQVTIFPEGLQRDNMDRFFTEGGQLDLLVEECDSVDIKVLARLKARELGIPVVMDTSDRGMIDVERFDLEPDRPLLHGLLEGLDLSLLDRPMTNLEKLPFMAQIVGLETISDRMRASIPELGKTIVTWPQLASGVALGGALVTDVCRRVLLGHSSTSGRWWTDIMAGVRSMEQTSKTSA